MKTGIELIAEERQRQIDVEKWDLKHDSDYKHGELVGAAMCYAAAYVNKHFPEDKPVLRAQVYIPPKSELFITGKVRNTGKWVDAWPWSKEYDKREKHDKLRCLVISAALIASEIDRLQTNNTDTDG